MIRRRGGLWIAILYFVLGIYFLNAPFNFIKFPEFIFKVANPWIVFIGGILLLVGGFNYLRIRRRYTY